MRLQSELETKEEAAGDGFDSGFALVRGTDIEERLAFAGGAGEPAHGRGLHDSPGAGRFHHLGGLGKDEDRAADAEFVAGFEFSFEDGNAVEEGTVAAIEVAAEDERLRFEADGPAKERSGDTDEIRREISHALERITYLSEWIGAAGAGLSGQ